MSLPARAEVQAAVREGYAAHQAGDLDRAEAAYRRALALDPNDANALQLLGLLRSRAGQRAEAEDLMRRSLAVNPAQAIVWNNLGTVLEATGRLTEALGCFDEAARREPRYATAHFNRARMLRALGAHDDAEAALRSARATSPAPTAAHWQLQAQLEADRGELERAIGSIDAALALRPDDPTLLHERATLRHRTGRHEEALLDHERARERGLDAAEAHYNRGNALQSVGRLDDAVAAYEAALARDPGHALALYDLARLRWRLGDPAFDRDLRAAEARDTASSAAPATRAHLLWRAERLEEAAAAYRTALERAPDDAALLDGLGRCLVRLGAVDDGLAAQTRATTLEPARAELHTNLAASLLLAGRPEAAEAAAQESHRLAPEDQGALAHLGLAWRLRGDPREAWLNDYEHFVRAVDLDPPPGDFEGMGFWDALLAWIEALHTDREAPVDQTLRRGTQTVGNLFHRRHPLIEALKQRLGAAIDAYVAALPSDPTHPFLARRAARWSYSDAWSSRLRRGGYHISHVHPHGWISAVIYLEVPAATGDPSRREGWLYFGRPDIDLGPAITARRLVQPRRGRVVLFPSMFWHGTTPFDDEQPRTTIAFDVLPRG